MYKALLNEAQVEQVDVVYRPLHENLKGLYYDQVIALNKNIETAAEKTCVLAEELGHYYTSFGNILDLSDVRNRKQEKRARKWAYKKLIPLKSLVKASKEGIRNRHELAEYLEVTEGFLEDTLSYYKEKYGLYVKWANYVIYFDPLGVFELFDEK